MDNIFFDTADTFIESECNLIKLFTCFGQGNTVFFTLDNLRVEILFEPLDLLRHRRLRNPQLLRRFRETLLLDNCQEGPQFRKIFQHSASFS